MYIVLVPTIVDILQAADAANGRPTYERFADVLARAIQDGTLAAGSRLPTVRSLSQQLGVSATTVMSIYSRLAERGLTTGEPGRGTFVRAMAPPEREAPPEAVVTRTEPSRAWRRQALAEAESRLRQAHPNAVDLTRGSPARDALPSAVLSHAWAQTATGLRAVDLEYPHTLAIDDRLWEALEPRLRRDGLATNRGSVVAMNSTQQFLSTVARVLERAYAPAAPVVGVEEPGYQTAMDTFERAGFRLVGMRVDEHGVTPEGLRAALSGGARMVVFTPRGLSPTGATWTEERRRELAEILLAADGVWVLEDDYFAELGSTRPGILAAEPGLRDRSLYVRGFSKSIGPDLRLAVGVAGAALLPALLEERSFCDGWTSSFTQRALAAALEDPALEPALQSAAERYRDARQAFADAWNDALPEGPELTPAGDGLHVWLSLPPGARSNDVVARCATNGYLVASGEPFFLAPGRRDHVRINVGTVGAEVAADVARTVAAAVRDVRGSGELLYAP